MTTTGTRTSSVKKKGFDFGGIEVDDDEPGAHKSPFKDPLHSALRPARLPPQADSMAQKL